MLGARILGVGLRGPGLNGWVAGSNYLKGITTFTNENTKLPLLESVPSKERRRLSPMVRLSLAVAEEAVKHSGIDAKKMCAVFSCPHGDTGIIQNILEELCTEERCVSPTDFHNSVHNVAVGYWSIFNGCQLPCTSVSAEIDTFAVALIKSFVQINSGGHPVLLTITDAPFSEPLNTVCPVGEPFATAMVLAPDSDGIGFAKLGIELENSSINSQISPIIKEFQDLWKINSAVRSLPILESLACQKDTMVVLPYGPFGNLKVKIEH
jgi:hypothetical protein